MRGLLALALTIAMSVFALAEGMDHLKTCISAAPDEALKACGRVIDDARAPANDRAGALYARSSLNNAVGKLDEALTDVDEALKILDKHPALLTRRAMTLSLQKKYSLAMRDANQALSLDPRNTEARLIRGLVHAASGDVHSARSELRNSLLYPDVSTFYGSAHAFARTELARLSALLPEDRDAKGSGPASPRTIVFLPYTAPKNKVDGRIVEAALKSVQRGFSGGQIDVLTDALACITKEMSARSGDYDEVVMASAAKCSGAAEPSGARAPRIDFIAILQIHTEIFEENAVRRPLFSLRHSIFEAATGKLVLDNVQSTIVGVALPGDCDQACVDDIKSRAIIPFAEAHGEKIAEDLLAVLQAPPGKP